MAGSRWEAKLSRRRPDAHRFESGSLILSQFETLEVGGVTIPFDTDYIFATLRRKTGVAETA